MKSKEQELVNLVSVLVGCGRLDIKCLLNMEENFEGTWERAKEFSEETGELNFGNFVMAVKAQALDQLYNEIPDDVYDALLEMVIDDNYLAWGTISEYGYGGYHDIQDEFAEWLTSGGTEYRDRIIEMCKQRVTA